MSSAAVLERRRVEVAGVVQGVGFRPYVYRLATELALTGLVGNDSTRVFIEVEGPADGLDRFVTRLRDEAPPLAVIESVAVEPIAPLHDAAFVIVASEERAGAITLVPPDVAVCADCVRELNDPTDRRHRHPFVTCTNCGPRFTIIRGLPYDRPATTMAGFPLCDACAAEYRDPSDRRYHAQPIGCHECGPSLTFQGRDGELAHRHDALAAACALLAAGGIVAIKGIGGYHLACDATAAAAVGELRRRKNRGDKPFAVMVPDLTTARRCAAIGDAEAAQLQSAANPIVLLQSLADTPLCAAVAPTNPLIGLLLPTTGLHHLLFAAGFTALVMTSGNRSGEPIAYRDDDAVSRLADLVDGFLTHDRPIHVPCDDSVVRVVDGALMPIRRSRGYAPLPVRLPFDAPPTLAVGAELKNTFCIAGGHHAWISQHIGDMENLDTLEAFEASVAQFGELYRVRPEVVVADAHPGYLTSGWARGHHRDRLTLVQHHHAHVAAIIAEHQLAPDRPVLGIAFDGTGFGDDRAIWGGEVLIADASTAQRVSHLSSVPLPGGDAAMRHPNRIALAHLWAAAIDWAPDIAAVAATPPDELLLLHRQLTTGFRCTPTTSVGRLFDAVSSLLGVRHDASYEAQAAIELEALAATWPDAPPTYEFGFDAECFDAAPVLRAMLADQRAGVPTSAIAAGFHEAVAAVVVALARRCRAGGGPTTVALTGGVFQNALLVTRTTHLLDADGFDVRTHRLVPPNDGGLALGQALIAAWRATQERSH